MARILQVSFLLAAAALALADSSDSHQSFMALKPSFSSYAAVGDSYAAGFGSRQKLGACTDDFNPASNTCTSGGNGCFSVGGCKKDTGSYAYQFAQKHGIRDFRYLACSGATTTDVIAQINDPHFGAPQLVTVHAGGDDDSAFYDLLMACVTFLGGDCTAHIQKTVGELDGILTNVGKTLAAVNDKIGSAPTRKVLMSYLEFFSASMPEACDPVGLQNVTRADRAKINALVQKANKGLELTAQKHGFAFASANGLIKGHRWCDGSNGDNAWIIDELSFLRNDTKGVQYCEIAVGHPTFAGQTAYLSALEKVLGM